MTITKERVDIVCEDFAEAQLVARRQERQTGQRHFVVAPDLNSQNWTVTQRMPFLGVWFDAQGHKHG